MSFEDEVMRVKEDYRTQLYKYTIPCEYVEKIVDAVLESAARARTNAGYSGSHSDGGAHQSIERLKGFLNGVHFQATGVLLDEGYKAIIDKAIREADPEYQKYLELKAKFE